MGDKKTRETQALARQALADLVQELGQEHPAVACRWAALAPLLPEGKGGRGRGRPRRAPDPPART